MTRDEHRNIIAFIDGAVRQDGAVAQMPLDVEADAIIRALFVRNPEAPFRVTQLAMAQREEISKLRTELAEAKSTAARNWLFRLLNRPVRQQTARRLDPDLSMFPQNVRSP